MERSAVLATRRSLMNGTGRIKERVMDVRGTNIPHRIIHAIMMESDGSVRKSKTEQRKWVKYERKYSNSMWHAGYKLLEDGRWVIAYQDDASRFVVGFGIFGEATGDHALDVLREAISKHGKPAAVITNHGPQFYASDKDAAKSSEAEFEKEIVVMGIKHMLARAEHSQSNGKLGRFYGELQRQLPGFVASSPANATRIPKGATVAHVGGPFCTDKIMDPVEVLVDWYNNKPHRSLDWKNHETPAQAFVRKAAPEAGATERAPVEGDR